MLIYNFDLEAAGYLPVLRGFSLEDLEAPVLQDEVKRARDGLIRSIRDNEVRLSGRLSHRPLNYEVADNMWGDNGPILIIIRDENSSSMPLYAKRSMLNFSKKNVITEEAVQKIYEAVIRVLNPEYIPVEGTVVDIGFIEEH